MPLSTWVVHSFVRLPQRKPVWLFTNRVEPVGRPVTHDEIGGRGRQCGREEDQTERGGAEARQRKRHE